jgi:site-specific recombinase XerD
MNKNQQVKLMGRYYKQKEVYFNYKGREIETSVVAKRDTDVLHPVASAFLFHKSLNGTKLSTVKTYASRLLLFIEELDRSQIESLDHISDSDMTAYLDKVLFEDRGNSAGTILQHITLLSDFFDYCYLQGFTSHPCHFSFTMSKKNEIALAKSQGTQNSHDPFNLPQKYIPPEQFKKFLSYETSKKPFIRDRNRLIFKLGYDAGLRAHEVVSWDNLSVSEFKLAVQKAKEKRLNEVRIQILGKGRGGGKIRTVDYSPELRWLIEDFINKYRNIIGDHIICSNKGEELKESYPTTIFLRNKKNLIKQADYSIAHIWSINECWSFHALRHSFCSNLGWKIITGELKVPMLYAQEQMGHTDPSTTAIYMHFAAANLANSPELAEQFAKQIKVNTVREKRNA